MENKTFIPKGVRKVSDKELLQRYINRQLKLTEPRLQSEEGNKILSQLAMEIAEACNKAMNKTNKLQ